MPKQSIEYLNERKNSARKGRTIFTKASRLVDQRAQWSEMDPLERADMELRSIFTDFNSWFRNLPSVDHLMDGSLEDLTF